MRNWVPGRDRRELAVGVGLTVLVCIVGIVAASAVRSHFASTLDDCRYNVQATGMRCSFASFASDVAGLMRWLCVAVLVLPIVYAIVAVGCEEWQRRHGRGRA